MVTFGLKGGRDAAVEMMDRLKMVAIVTHVADARSCVLHPASHTHRQMNDKELVEAGVQLPGFPGFPTPILYDQKEYFPCMGNRLPRAVGILSPDGARP